MIHTNAKLHKAKNKNRNRKVVLAEIKKVGSKVNPINKEDSKSDSEEDSKSNSKKEKKPLICTSFSKNASSFKGYTPSNGEVVDYFEKKYNYFNGKVKEEELNGLVFLEEAIETLKLDIPFNVRVWSRNKEGTLTGKILMDSPTIDWGKWLVYMSRKALLGDIGNGEFERRNDYEFFREGDYRNSLLKRFRGLDTLGFKEMLLKQNVNPYSEQALELWYKSKATWFDWKKVQYMDYFSMFVAGQIIGTYWGDCDTCPWLLEGDIYDVGYSGVVNGLSEREIENEDRELDVERSTGNKDESKDEDWNVRSRVNGTMGLIKNKLNVKGKYVNEERVVFEQSSPCKGKLGAYRKQQGHKGYEDNTGCCEGELRPYILFDVVENLNDLIAYKRFAMGRTDMIRED